MKSRKEYGEEALQKYVEEYVYNHNIYTSAERTNLTKDNIEHLADVVFFATLYNCGYEYCRETDTYEKIIE